MDYNEGICRILYCWLNRYCKHEVKVIPLRVLHTLNAEEVTVCKVF